MSTLITSCSISAKYGSVSMYDKYKNTTLNENLIPICNYFNVNPDDHVLDETCAIWSKNYSVIRFDANLIKKPIVNYYNRVPSRRVPLYRMSRVLYFDTQYEFIFKNDEYIPFSHICKTINVNIYNHMLETTHITRNKYSDCILYEYDLVINYDSNYFEDCHHFKVNRYFEKYDNFEYK